MPFPHNDSENADLLGVFWSDFDSTGVSCDCQIECRTCGRSVVYYHVYSNNLLQNDQLDEFSKQILSRASHDGQKYITGFVEANWVMVVKWSQMIPFPYTYNQYSSEVCKFCWG